MIACRKHSAWTKFNTKNVAAVAYRSTSLPTRLPTIFCVYKYDTTAVDYLYDRSV